MRYTYQYLVLEANGRVTTDKEQIDASAWLDYLAAHTDRYGNLGEFVTAALAALPTQDPLVASAITADIDEMFCTQQPTAVFQFAMYCWEELQAGRLSAQAWSASSCCKSALSERNGRICSKFWRTGSITASGEPW